MQAGQELGITVYVMGTNNESNIAIERLLINHVIEKGCLGLVLVQSENL
ncbi:hypothetical protein [Psychromonas hadalis]|nr:hypothetical protein [Psychromonas hadalis]